MNAAEIITKALDRFFAAFELPVYPEDRVPRRAALPYLTVQTVIPKGFDETAVFHARLWYPSDGGRVPILRKTDELRVALGDGLTIECEGGAVLLCAGNPWAQPMDDPAASYLCQYLNFEITSFVV